MSYARARNVINSTTNFPFVKHQICRSDSFLAEIANIAEAFAEYILGVADNKEGVFIDIPYNFAYIGDLSALYNTQQHLLILVGVCPLAREDRHAAVKLIGYVLHELLAVFADNIAHA